MITMDVDLDIAEFDLREYLQFLQVSFSEHGQSGSVSRGWVGIQCIYCDDHGDHMGVNLAQKYFSCWRCQVTGSLLTLIQDIEGINYGAALHRIGDFQTFVPFEAERSERLRDNGQSILPNHRPLTQGQIGYLQGRRFDPDRLARDWGLVSGPISGPWRYRIIIPVTLGRRVVTWIGLDTAGVRSAKYKAASVQESFIPTSELLYGADYVGKNVLVVEGAADVWRMGRGAVALLGMGQTVNKLEPLISLEAERYFIMLDGEPQAIENARRIAHDLSSHSLQVEVLELDSGDPDDLDDFDVQKWREELEL